MVRRPIEISYHSAGLWVFNDTEEEHTLEITFHRGDYVTFPSNEAWITEQRVLFRGANPPRELTTADAMLLTHST
jgi:hypothetical protein